jgi:hypothetical protein
MSVYSPVHRHDKRNPLKSPSRAKNTGENYVIYIVLLPARSILCSDSKGGAPMHGSCRLRNILIASFVGLVVSVLGLIGALTDLNAVYLVVLAISILSLALVTIYSMRKDLLRTDLKCLLYSSFIAIAASVLGIIIDILTLLELPILFVAVAAGTLVLIAVFQFIKFISRRGW